MTDAVELKAKARAEGKDGQAGVYKTIANSSYGFWALNTHDREGLVIGKHETVNPIEDLENLEFLFSRRKKVTESLKAL